MLSVITTPCQLIVIVFGAVRTFTRYTILAGRLALQGIESIANRNGRRRGKTRITIRLDEDLVEHFLKEADASGGAMGYQTLINDVLRRIVREEVRAAG